MSSSNSQNSIQTRNIEEHPENETGSKNDLEDTTDSQIIEKDTVEETTVETIAINSPTKACDTIERIDDEEQCLEDTNEPASDRNKENCVSNVSESSMKSDRVGDDTHVEDLDDDQAGRESCATNSSCTISIAGSERTIVESEQIVPSPLIQVGNVHRQNNYHYHS